LSAQLPASSSECPQCGQARVNGTCPACDDPALYRFVHREIVLLLVLSSIALIVFILTRRAAAAHESLRRREAAAWFALGQAKLDSMRWPEAVSAFQHASTASRDNATYRLALARALTANHQEDAARQVLLALRQLSPENPEINGALARLEARRADDAGRTAGGRGRRTGRRPHRLACTTGNSARSPGS
jgi:hypothetical protein